MTETLLMLYTMFAAAGTFALLSLLGAAELRARRRRRAPRAFLALEKRCLTVAVHCGNMK